MLRQILSFKQQLQWLEGFARRWRAVISLLTFLLTAAGVFIAVAAYRQSPLEKVSEWRGREYHSENFDDWDIHKAATFSKTSRTIVLQRGALLGYILSKDSLPEHAEVIVRFTPHSKKIDFFIRLENAYQVIIGDGDDRSISLKKKGAEDDALWQYVTPPGFSDDRLPKYFLPSAIPADKEVTIKLIIDAPESSGNSRSVQVTLKFFDDDGNIINSGQPMEWEFTIDGVFNGDKRYGLGLITKRPLQKQPSVTIHDFMVKERQQTGGENNATPE